MFETLLSLIERGVAALEKIAAAGGVQVAATAANESAGEGKPSRKQKATSEQAQPEKEYTDADVRKALTEYGEKTGDMDKARELLKKHGDVSALKDLKKDKYAAVVKAAEAAMKEASKSLDL